MKSVKDGASGDFTFYKVHGYDPVKYYPLKIVDELVYDSWITSLVPRTPTSNECYSLNQHMYVDVPPLPPNTWPNITTFSF